MKEIFNHNSRLNKPLINSRGKKFVDIFSCFDYNSQPSDFTGENQKLSHCYNIGGQPNNPQHANM